MSGPIGLTTTIKISFNIILEFCFKSNSILKINSWDDNYFFDENEIIIIVHLHIILF